MTSGFDARACGPGSLWRWHRRAGGLARQLAMEIWLGVWAGLAALAWACWHYPALWPAALVLGIILGRGLWGAAGRLLDGSLASPRAQAAAFFRAIPPAWGVCCATLSLAGLVWSLASPGLSGAQAWRSPMDAWVLAPWMAWAVRPWGPIGFIGALRALGCPSLLSFRLQARAFWLNPESLMGLLAVWLGVLVVLLALPALALGAVVAWPLVLRCAYQDIFLGGLAPSVPAAAVATTPAGQSRPPVLG